MCHREHRLPTLQHLICNGSTFNCPTLDAKSTSNLLWEDMFNQRLNQSGCRQFLFAHQHLLNLQFKPNHQIVHPPTVLQECKLNNLSRRPLFSCDLRPREDLGCQRSLCRLQLSTNRLCERTLDRCHLHPLNNLSDRRLHRRCIADLFLLFKNRRLFGHRFLLHKSLREATAPLFDNIHRHLPLHKSLRGTTVARFVYHRPHHKSRREAMLRLFGNHRHAAMAIYRCRRLLNHRVTIFLECL